MIGRVLPRGGNLRGLLHYLYGKGKHARHVNPHLVAGWVHPAEIEPPRRKDGKRSFSRLTELMELPVQVARGKGRKVPGKYVYHLTVRCAPDDPDLGDGAWHDIATEIVDRLGLSVRGREDQGVRWIAVHHGDNHIHIVAALASQDYRVVWPKNDYYRLAETLRETEKKYGLQILVAADRTAARGLTRPEMERSARTGRPPDRSALYRTVRTIASAARTEEEFFAAIEARGLMVRLRHSTVRPEEVTGYAVALDHGPGQRTVWFGGGKLAPDLTLPKLRAKWSGPRLSGRGMADRPARTVLAREAARAARAARSEGQFLAALDRYGLQVRLRPDPARPGRPAGYSVTLPGLADKAGRPVWYSGTTLGLPLGELRARWRAGQPGAGPGPDYFTGASRAEVYEHAAAVAARAAAEMKASPAGRPDVAWAAADVLTAAAEITGNPEMARAAEGFTRAARAAWGRTPAPSPAGQMLRTAAYLIASTRPARQSPLTRAIRQMLIALARLARALAELRAAQARRAQAAAALSAAAGLDDITAAIDQASTALSPAALSAAAFPRQPLARRPFPAPGPAPRPRPPEPPGKGRSPGR
jgi:hypothetical protein